MNRLTQYRDNVYPLRWEAHFAAERALLMVLPQIDHFRVRARAHYMTPEEIAEAETLINLREDDNGNSD